MPVNINYFTSQPHTQGNQRTKGHGSTETLPRIPSLKNTDMCIKQIYLSLPTMKLQKKLGEGHQMK